MTYIDTHFHLDLMPSPEKTVEEIEKNRIYTIAVTNAPSVFINSLNLTAGKKYVKAALGLHPELMLERKGELPLFLELLENTRYVGEVGLDYSMLNEQERHDQLKIFEQIIRKCSEYKDKILTIHSRNATTDVISTIGENFPGKVILHWYSGNLKELQRAIDYGFYFSVNYAMANSEKGKRIIKGIPIDRLLTESDGPFVQIKNEPFTPIKIPCIIHALSQCLVIAEDKLKEIIFENFKSLL